MRSILTTVTALAALACAPAANASEWELTGFAGFDLRAFWLDAQFPGQLDTVNVSAVVQPELYWSSDNDQHRVAVVAYGRLDDADDERTHADIREAFWGYEGSGFDTVVGVAKVFWGVAESRHLVDVVNQTDLVENLDEESKLGQPMLNLNISREFGRVGFYVLPYFRERTFAGNDGRLRPGLVVDSDNPIYESGDEENHVDFALRYSHYIGNVDLGLHVFEGTSREPRFELSTDGQRLLPVYDQMTQFGVDLQYTSDAWLWKLEAISRDTRVDQFFAAVGGFEYTLYGVNDSAIDVGIVAEYLFDDRNQLSAPTAFENDLFAGARIAWNDADDSAVLAGAAIDLDTQELFLNIEAEKRFGERLKAELFVRALLETEPGGALDSFRQDDHVELQLAWFW